MIAGFLAPDDGDIRIGGRSMRGVAPNRRPVNMVFQHLALFPMMTRRRQRRLRPCAARRRARGDRAARRRDAGARRPARRAGQAHRPALRRTEAARRDRAQPRARADAAAARRAARRARSQAARAHEDRAEAAAGRFRHDVRLHHARPVGGAGAVRPRRGDECRPLRAGRHAAGALLPAARRRSSRASSAPTTASPGARRARRRRHRRGRDRRRTAVRARRRAATIGAGDSRRGVRAAGSRRISRAIAASFRPPRNALPVASRACCSTARTRRCWSARRRTRAEIRIALPQTGRFADLARRRDGRVRLRPAARRLLRAPAAWRAEATARRAARRARAAAAAGAGAGVARRRSSCCRTSSSRVLSLRARVAPRVYEWSLDQYRTFIDEPLYWHTFVRTAAMSIVATACTLLIAFPAAWYIAKIARGRAKSRAVRAVPDSVLGERDRAHARAG